MPREIPRTDIKRPTTSASRASIFLENLVDASGQFDRAVIYHHNDMDGLASAVLAKQMLQGIGLTMSREDIIPISYVEARDISIPSDRLVMLLDLPLEMFTENVFRIDRHGDMDIIAPNTFLVVPRADADLPISTACLVAYLHHKLALGKGELEDFIKGEGWKVHELTRWMLILSCIATNLDHLTPTSNSPFLRRWINELGFPEEDVAIYSVGVSLLLGRHDKGTGQLSPLHEWNGSGSMESVLDSVCADVAVETSNLWVFAKSMDREIRRHVREIRRGIDAQIEKLDNEREGLDLRLRSLRKSAPEDTEVDEKQAIPRHEDEDDDLHGKHADAFYSEEQTKLKNQIRGLLDRINALKARSNARGLVVFLPQQTSTQVKGILASLFYYYGWRNIVIEDRGPDAVWGSRGFRRAALERHLASYTVNMEMLDQYVDAESFVKGIPEEHRKYLSQAQDLIVQKRYVGQIGGHGTVFGGSLEGWVPNLFAILDASTIDRTLEDLVKRGELAAALKGFTESRTMTPTVKALRTKFKGKDWITVQVTTTKGSGDILLGDVGLINGWVLGNSVPLQVTESI